MVSSQYISEGSNHTTLYNMCTTSSGMKRSMPCTDLISMQSPDDCVLMRLVDERLKGWEQDSALAEIATTAKKPRLSPLVTLNDSPATEALEHFLRFAVEEVPSIESLSTDNYTIEETSMFVESSLKLSRPCSLLSKTKANYRMSDINEVTYGMSRISASS